MQVARQRASQLVIRLWNTEPVLPTPCSPSLSVDHGQRALPFVPGPLGPSRYLALLLPSALLIIYLRFLLGRPLYDLQPPSFAPLGPTNQVSPEQRSRESLPRSNYSIPAIHHYHIPEEITSCCRLRSRYVSSLPYRGQGSYRSIGNDISRRCTSRCAM